MIAISNNGYLDPPIKETNSSSTVHNEASPDNLPNSDQMRFVIHTLMCHRQNGESEEFAKRAIDSLVKKIKDRQEGINSLITAITTSGTHPTNCVTIQRTLDGRMQIAGRKCLPHVIYARIWRWPDLQRNELRHTKFCAYGFDTKRDLICINPYHYERFVSSVDFASLTLSPNGEPDHSIPDISDSESDMPDASNSSRTSRSVASGNRNDCIVADAYANSRKNDLVFLTEPPLDASSSFNNAPRDRVNPTPCPDQGHGNTMAWSGVGSDRLTSILPNPTMTVDCDRDRSDDLKAAYHLAKQLIVTEGAGSDSGANNNSSSNSGTCGGESSSRQGSCSSNNPTSSFPGGGSGRGWSGGGDGIRGGGPPSGGGGGGNQQPPFAPPPPGNSLLMSSGMLTAQRLPEFWCNIAYFELDQQVGELFKVPSQFSRVTIDGYTDPSNPNRFCLGQLSNVHRSEQSEKSRLYIGKGVELDLVGEGDVWIHCLSEFSVFVQSYYLDREAGRAPGDAVHKIYPGAYIKVFDIRQCHEQMKLLAQSAQAAAERQAAAVVGATSPLPTTQQGPSSPPSLLLAANAGGVGVDDLRRLCMLRLSFVKGWGPDYPRHCIKETPCWIEIQLHRPLQLLDEVLQAMPLNDLKPTRHFFNYNNQGAPVAPATVPSSSTQPVQQPAAYSSSSISNPHQHPPRHYQQPMHHHTQQQHQSSSGSCPPPPTQQQHPYTPVSSSSSGGTGTGH